MQQRNGAESENAGTRVNTKGDNLDDKDEVQNNITSERRRGGDGDTHKRQKIVASSRVKHPKTSENVEIQNVVVYSRL